MGRISRSLELVKQSYRILMQDKELVALPLISGVVIAVAVVIIALGFGVTSGEQTDGNPLLMVAAFGMYVVTYAIGIFFQAAVIAGATERMRGGDPTVASALGAASRRLGPIVLWAIFAATVGMLLKSGRNRSGFIGRMILGMVGVAWSLATFFIVPVLVLEERSVTESFTQSMAVFKKTWGETMVGGVSIGAVSLVVWLALFGVVALVAATGAEWLAVAVAAVGAMILVPFFSALQGVYVASLYRYATEGQAPAGFDQGLLAEAFVTKS